MPFSSRKQYVVKLKWEGKSRTSVNFSCNNTQAPPLIKINVTFINYIFPKLGFKVLDMKQTTGYFFHWDLILQEILCNAMTFP